MTILCYHSVQPDWVSPLNTEPEVFARQAAWLARRRMVVPLRDAVRRLDGAGRLPRGYAALTFDDGFSALHQHAWPVLARMSLPATVFLVAQTLSARGRPVDWVDTPPPYALATLTRDQVLEMQEGGLDFQSHSYSHFDLTTLDFASCVEDLRRSRLELEDLLGRPVPYLAYPRGRNNADVRMAAARAGYQHAFTLPERAEPIGPYGIPRVGVYQGNSLLTVSVKCAHPYLGVRTHPAFPRVAQQARRLARR